MASAVVDECPFEHSDEPHPKKNDLSNNSGTLADNLGPKDDTTVTFVVRGSERTVELGFAAHHLIPGGSIKHAAPLLKWMKKGSTVKGDVGYEQNDAANGVWLIATHRFPNWGAATKRSDDELQFAYAYEAMKEHGAQLHRWDGAHADYNAWVRRTLEKIRVKLLEQRAGCSICKQRKMPFPPPYKLVGMLHDLAARIGDKVTGPVSGWRPPLCTSTFAVRMGQKETPAK